MKEAENGAKRTLGKPMNNKDANETSEKKKWHHAKYK